jgi:hypothetical protein
MQNTVTVIGRNGCEYDATPIKGNLFVVGKFVVSVVNGRCDETLCKATKANIAKFAK